MVNTPRIYTIDQTTYRGFVDFLNACATALDHHAYPEPKLWSGRVFEGLRRLNAYGASASWTLRQAAGYSFRNTENMSKLVQSTLEELKDNHTDNADLTLERVMGKYFGHQKLPFMRYTVTVFSVIADDDKTGQWKRYAVVATTMAEACLRAACAASDNDTIYRADDAVCTIDGPSDPVLDAKIKELTAS